MKSLIFSFILATIMICTSANARTFNKQILNNSKSHTAPQSSNASQHSKDPNSVRIQKEHDIQEIRQPNLQLKATLPIESHYSDQFVNAGKYIVAIGKNTLGQGELGIYDKSDPQNLKMLGHYPSGQVIASMDSLANIVYICVNGAIELIDISKPTTPQKVGRIETQDDPIFIKVKTGNLIFAITQNSSEASDGKLVVYDASEPTNIKHLNTVLLKDTGRPENSSYDNYYMVLTQKYLLLRTAYGFDRYNIENPINILFQGSYRRNSHDVITYSIAANENTAYVVSVANQEMQGNQTRGLFETINISNPDQLYFRGSIEYDFHNAVDSVHFDRSFNMDIVIDDSYTYIVDGFEILGINISDLANPQISNTYPDNDINQSPIAYNGLLLSNLDTSKIFTLSKELGIDVLENRNDGRLQYFSNTQTGGNNRHTTLSIQSEKGLAYSYAKGVVSLIDIKNPTEPHLNSEFSHNIENSENFEGDIAHFEDYILTNHPNYSLASIYNPETDSPTAETFYTSPNEQNFIDAKGIYMHGTTAFVSGYNGLEMIDVSMPANPQYLGGVYGFMAYSTAVKGSYAYVIEYTLSPSNNNLRVYDISNKATPKLINTLTYSSDRWTPYEMDDPNPADKILIRGNYAYITAKEYGVLIFDLSNPTTPVEVGSYSVDGSSALSLAIDNSGQYLFAGFSHHGVQVISIADPTSPQLISELQDSIINQAIDLEVSGGYLYAVTKFGLHTIKIY